MSIPGTEHIGKIFELSASIFPFYDSLGENQMFLTCGVRMLMVDVYEGTYPGFVRVKWLHEEKIILMICFRTDLIKIMNNSFISIVSEENHP